MVHIFCIEHDSDDIHRHIQFGKIDTLERAIEYIREHYPAPTQSILPPVDSLITDDDAFAEFLQHVQFHLCDIGYE